MAGPWEKYKSAAPAEDGPWAKYSKSAPKEEPIVGLAPGQKLPGIHGPKVQMQEVSTPSSIASGFGKKFGGEFLDNANPVNTIRGIGSALSHPIQNLRDAHDADKQFDEANRFLDEQNARPVNATTVAEDLGSKLGAETGGLAQTVLTDAALRGIHGVKAPIGERIRAEESRLDRAGIRPNEQNIRNHFDNARSKNQTSGGVPLNEAKDARFNRVENQISDIYSHPDIAPTFSDVSGLKSELQREGANGGFFDSPDVKASTAGAGESSRAIRRGLRETPGAEDWAELEDKAARGHRIDELAGKVGGAIGGAAGPAIGTYFGHAAGGAAGALGIKPGVSLGQKLGQNVSNYFTSGRAANQLIKPLQSITPKPFIEYPTRPGAAPEPFVPKGLIGPARGNPLQNPLPSESPLITPAPEGSFPVSGPMPFNPPKGSGVNRLIEAPKQVPSLGFAVSDDLVPVTHPVTKKIEYIPKWMANQKP